MISLYVLMPLKLTKFNSSSMMSNNWQMMCKSIIKLEKESMLIIFYIIGIQPEARNIFSMFIWWQIIMHSSTLENTNIEISLNIYETFLNDIIISLKTITTKSLITSENLFKINNFGLCPPWLQFSTNYEFRFDPIPMVD